MTSEQKAAALSGLGEMGIALEIGRTVQGGWHASVKRAEYKEEPESGVLCGLVGFGSTPYAAVDECWERATTFPHIVVLDSFKPTRREVTWTGFMWADRPVRESAK